MEGYDFFDDGDDSTDAETTTEQKDWGVERWSLGEHQEGPDGDWSQVEDNIEFIENQAPGLADALSEAKETAQTFSVSGFECSVCGLNHSHSDNKHDIRDIFNVTTEFAEEMKFSPFCHCGVSELARLVMYFPDVEGIAMFEDQHEFESVLEIPTPVVRNIYRAMQEVTVEEAHVQMGMSNMAGSSDRKLHLNEAVEWERRRTGDREAVPEGIRSELEQFYNRVDRIRSAANSAPIPSETEQSLNKNLGEL
jgi:hypothetical protein